jgi:hypothetical protein
MFGLFRRAHTTGVGSGGRTVLLLEGLEGRYQPSGADTAPLLLPADGTTAATAGDKTNDPPEIVNFNAQQIGNGVFLITGRVVDEDPDGLIVTLGGSTSANGKWTFTNEDGTFSLLVQLKTDGTDTGWITATTIDDWGLVSDEVEVFVTPTP